MSEPRPTIEAAEFRFEPLLGDPLYGLVPRLFVTTRKKTIALANA